MNPVVREIANEYLGDDDRIHIIEPLDVLDFHNFLSRSYLILTDSGGIQEEAPSLGKPVLVIINKDNFHICNILRKNRFHTVWQALPRRQVFA